MSSVNHAKIFAALDCIRSNGGGTAIGELGELTPQEDVLLRELLAKGNPAEVLADTPVRNVTAAPTTPSADEATPQHLGVYRIEREVGQGAFGRVFLAVQPGTHRKVAIKVLRHSVSENEARRFEFEAEALARLDHPGVTSVYECLTAQHQPCLVMEYVEGVPIDEYVQKNSLDARRILELLIEACHAISHAHQRGVIHRDLAPKHLLVTTSGHVKVLDFGLARDIVRPTHALQHTISGSVLGTIPFACPEQLGGDMRKVDSRSDVYALGVIAFVVLTGTHPYLDGSESLASAVRKLATSEVAPILTPKPGRIGHGLEAVLRKCVERDMRQRYQSADALASDFRALLEFRPVEATNPGLWRHALAHVQRHRAAMTAIAMSTVLVMGMAVNNWRASRREEDARETAMRSIQTIVDRVLSPLAPRIGTLTDRERLLEDIGPDIQSIANALPGDPRSIRLQAGYQYAMGDVYREKGRPERATDHFREAQNAYSRLVALDPEDFATSHIHSITMVKLGDLLDAQQYRQAAADQYLSALHADIQLAARHPDAIGALSNLYWSYRRCGDHPLVPSTTAMDYRAQSRTVAQQLMRRAPDSPRALEAQLDAYLDEWTTICNKPDQFEHSVQLLQNALPIGERLIALEPNVVTHHTALLLVLIRMMNNTRTAAYTPEWMAYAEHARAAEARLRANEGAERLEDEALFELSQTLARAANIKQDWAEAIAQCSTAEEDAQRVLSSHAENPFHAIQCAQLLSEVMLKARLAQGDALAHAEVSAKLSRLSQSLMSRSPNARTKTIAAFVQQRALEVAEKRSVFSAPPE